MHVLNGWSLRSRAGRLLRLQDVLNVGEATNSLLDTVAYCL